MKSISRTQVSELLGYWTFFKNCFTLFQIGIPMPITRSQRSKIIGYEKDLGLLRLSAIIRCSEERPASLVWAPLPTQEPLVNTNLLTFIDFEKWTLNVDLAHSFQGQFCSKIFWRDKPQHRRAHPKLLPAQCCIAICRITISAKHYFPKNVGICPFPYTLSYK